MSQNVPNPPKPEGSKPKRKYKKRVRKVSPTEGLLSDNKEKTKEIPLYDPYTGEPNPHYEELTGKPNPLTTPKGFTIDGVAEKSRMGLPIMNKKIEVEPTKEFLDVKTNNRFLVVFPEEFGINEFYVKSIERPIMIIKRKKIFGIEYTDRVDEIFQSKNFFDVKIEIVNPIGLVVEEMNLLRCYISEIMFSPLSYSDDNLSTTTIKLNPSAYSIK